jgi:tetratricopeptide (TPR) repeat protein
LKAFKYLRKAEQLEPDWPIAFYFRYCAYFYNVGKPDHALIALKLLREAHPDFLPIYFTIGEIHQYLGNLFLAVIWYRRVLRINPECKEALLALSLIYCNDFNDRDKAIFYAQKLLNLDPENSTAQINLAIAKMLPVGRKKNLISGKIFLSNGVSNLFNVSPLELKNANQVIYSFFSNR